MLAVFLIFTAPADRDLADPEIAAFYEAAVAASERWGDCTMDAVRSLAPGPDTPEQIISAAFGLCKVHELAWKNTFYKLGGDRLTTEQVANRRIGEVKASFREIAMGEILAYRHHRRK